MIGKTALCELYKVFWFEFSQIRLFVSEKLQLLIFKHAFSWLLINLQRYNCDLLGSGHPDRGTPAFSQ